MDTQAVAHLAAILAIAVTVAPVATVAAAQASIPGEALYGLKRASEAITASGAMDKLDRRVGELQALAERNPDPALIEQSARDIEALVPAVVAEADSLDDIERAETGLASARAAIEAVIAELGEDHESYFGLSTALDAIDGGVDGLELARNALELGEDSDARPDVELTDAGSA